MLVPVVQLLAQHYPKMNITVLSVPAMAPLFEGLGDNVRFIGADIHREFRGINGLSRLFTYLREENFDAVADCHDVLRTKYLRTLFKFVRCKVECINKSRDGKRALTKKDDDKVFMQQATSFENYADTIDRLLGTSLKSYVIRTNVPDNKYFFPTGRIGVAPFAKHKGKVYPLDKMKEVVKALLEKGKQVYLFGAGEEEVSVFHEWKDYLPHSERVFLPPYGTSLRDELQLMATLDCMVSMDSANQHLASIVGTRVVSVWGSTHPYAGFLGWKQNFFDCVQLSMPCRPCSIYGNKKCRMGDFPCMNNIQPEDILAKVLKV
ncbi:MAG: glycosyltransferase family 9 protein [Bacteroidaceae bacterium]|nr:glycosyltransferase family 9 protein [Bacteroidaceae bacterium]